MATCIKTGAQLYLTEYGAYVYGDLHQISEDVFVVRTATARSFEPINNSSIVHGLIHETYEWWGEHDQKQSGTLVVTRMEYLGYEGVELVPAKPAAISPS